MLMKGQSKFTIKQSFSKREISKISMINQESYIHFSTKKLLKRLLISCLLVTVFQILMDILKDFYSAEICLDAEKMKHSDLNGEFIIFFYSLC